MAFTQRSENGEERQNIPQERRLKRKPFEETFA